MNDVDLLARDPVADALCALRDELGRLDHAGTGLLERDAVLAVARTHIDRRVFGDA